MSTDEKIKEYTDYLQKYSRKHNVSVWQAHQHVLCREVAKEYGLTKDDLRWLDENL